MKRIMTIALLLFSGIVLGKGEDKVFDVTINKVGTSLYSVRLEKAADDQIAIRILSADRASTIYSEIVRKAEVFRKKYDFSNLENEKYIISVSNGDYVYEKTVIKSEEGISEDFGALITTGNKRGHVEVRLTNNPAKVRRIQVRDHNGLVIYEHTDLENKGYDFDLNPLNRGVYKVEVIGKELTVSKYITKI